MTTYRDCVIENHGNIWTWTHPDTFDADYLGDDHWQTTGSGMGNSEAECREEIDEYLDSLVSQQVVDTMNRFIASVTEPVVGERYTNGKVTLRVLTFDDSGVAFDNGYCPNRTEFELQWRKA